MGTVFLIHFSLTLLDITINCISRWRGVTLDPNRPNTMFCDVIILQLKREKVKVDRSRKLGNTGNGFQCVSLLKCNNSLFVQHLYKIVVCKLKVTMSAQAYMGGIELFAPLSTGYILL